MKRGKSLALFALLLGASSSWAGTASDPVEVVQSVPLETTLSIPGIRETQAVWLEMIGAAKRSIDLEQFYVSDQAGEALRPVLQAIEDAANRGVHVRLLVDQKFYQQYPDSVKEIGATPGCEAKSVDFSSYGGVQHAKYFIVDGRESFVGSQNFDWRALSHIHEVGLRVSDSAIASGLESIFEKDWASGAQAAWAGFSDLFHGVFSGHPSDLTLLASPPAANPPGVSDSLSAITGLLASARSSVRIQVMEYTTKTYGNAQTWKALDNAIRGAAGRGVRVQLMVDVSAMKSGSKDLAALKAVPNVEVTTVTIPQYSGGAIQYARLIHSKYMIVDGAIGWVGSENWSQSYFTQTRDVGLVVRAPNVVSQLNQIFDRVWNSSYASR